jgi:hypothetical protein
MVSVKLSQRFTDVINEPDVVGAALLTTVTAHRVLFIDKIIQTELFSYPDREQTAGERLVVRNQPASETHLNRAESDFCLPGCEYALPAVDGSGIK